MMDNSTIQKFDLMKMMEGCEDPEQKITLEFGPFEAVHRWKRMLECDQFVGSRRSKHTVVAYKDAIYVFGGDNSRSMLNDLIRFDVKEKSWGRAFSNGTPPAPRYHHSAVVHGTSMYVFGGYTGDILANSNLTNKNDMFEYKFLTGQWLEWRFQGVMPVPRSAHGAAVHDDKLWIYAGYDGNARLNDMWTINLVSGNPDNRQWEQVEQRGQCPPTCCNFPAVVARGRMYVFSGQSGAKITNALFQFDFAEKTWTRISTEHILRCAGPAPARRYGHTMLPHARHLYVFGGTADNTLPNDLHCYDLDTEMWSVVQPTADSQVPSGRLFHAGAVVGDAMYIFGGTVDNKTRSAELYRFQFSTYPRCTLHDDFGRFLKSRMFCDVECLVGPSQTSVLCHQAFLAGRSDYLRDKIQAARELHELDLQSSELSSREQGGDQRWVGGDLLKVYLPEATPQAFTMLLHYIYTDRIDPTEKEGSASSASTMLVVLEVLGLAERLRVPRLQALCARYLRATLARHNVLPALHAAHRTQLPTVKEYCLRFVVKDANYTHIVMSSEFEEMDKDLMVEVIRRRQVPASKPFWNDCDDDNVGTTLQQDMRALLSGGLLADVRLASAGRVREAHRTVLAARASYFEAMFRSFAPPDNTVNIQICHTVPSPDAFDSLLRYIYYGETQMPPENSLYLFQAPVFYGFTNNRLQVFCKENLESNVTPENVLPILAAADRLQAALIKNYALCMIVKHFTKVARQPELQDLNKHLLLDVLQALADGSETRESADVNDHDDSHHALHTSHSRK